MSTWLFDLGNTRLKFSELGTDGSPGESRAIAHDDAGTWMRDLPRGDAAVRPSSTARADAERRPFFSAASIRFCTACSSTWRFTS